MQRSATPLALGGMLVMALAHTDTSAAEHRIVLREHVNRQWTNELLSYPFEAAEGACHVASVGLRGPGGPVPVQLSEVEAWPGARMMKSARLWLVADLAPLAEDAYSVTYGPTSGQPPSPRGDLVVTARDGLVEMTTSLFGARVRLGDQVFEQPLPASDVPGPLVALRLADGTWFGGSRMFGETRIVSWSAEATGKGPVFGQVETTYRYEDGNVLKLNTRLHAGAAALTFETEVPEDRPNDGLDVVLSPGLPPLTLVAQREAYGDRPQMKTAKWADWVEIPLQTYTEEVVTKLSPWADWWSTWTQTSVRLRMSEQRELHVASRNPGEWVEPAAPGTMRDWGAWQHKLAPLMKTKNGEAFLRVNNAAGRRVWSVEDREPAYAEERRMSRAQVKAEWPPLNEVKDWVLDWEAGEKTVHPHLYVSPEDLQDARERLEPDKDTLWLAGYLAKEEIRPVPSYKDAQAVEVYLKTRGDPDATGKIRLVDRARQHMGALGDFDKMRSTQTVAALYDLIMGTDLIDEQEKRLYRSQMAFLGYMVARPSTWSIERGYRSYNPNMSLSYLLARGAVAAAIPSHPMAEEWVKPGLSRVKTWLAEVGPEGEWYESAHYSQVSAFAVTCFAVALKEAGFEDLFLNANLKKWAMWLAQIYTPRDPMQGRRNRRASPPIGRATAGVPWALFGLMAKATVATDPQYSREMQWAWAGTDYTLSTASHLGGFECVCLDPTLPMEVPKWRSKLFPQVGPLFRNGVGEEHENYLIVHANTGAGVRPSELGCLALWFARGVPVAGSFPGGYKERHQLLMSRVIPALSWNQGEPWDEARFGCDTSATMGSFSALPRQDYFTASYVHKGWKGGKYGKPENPVAWPPAAQEPGFPIAWSRRMLYIQDDQPKGANYLVLRDSVSGGKPTLWQMWTLSEKIGTPDQVRDREAFLAEKPDKTPVAAHALQGNRFTALGQFGVDIEIYVANPADPQPWTMRWGQRYVDYAVQGEDFRDLLQLRLNGDGDYFVALVPRFSDEAPPELTAMADGAVVKVAGTFGTDYCFLPSGEAEATADKVFFRGTAGSVQDREGSLVLATGSSGEVRSGEWGISAPQAASVRVEKERVVMDLSHDAKDGGEATLRVAGAWKLADGQAGVAVTGADAGLKLVLPAGLTRAELVRQ